MKNHTGIWIDHEKAVIVAAASGGVTTTTLKSGLQGHPHYSGKQEGEKNYEERHRQALGQYYDEVIDRLDEPDALLILGPGEAKLELKERLGRSKTPLARTVEIEAADKLTDPQIVAKVKAHFANDR